MACVSVGGTMPDDGRFPERRDEVLKRILLTAVVMLAVLVPSAPAQAHGICQVTEASWYGPTGGILYHSGTAECSDNTVHTMTMLIERQRRQVGGEWNTIGTLSRGPTSTYRLHDYTTSPWDCRKDYRTRVSMTANGHPGDAAVSSVRYHTC